MGTACGKNVHVNRQGSACTEKRKFSPPSAISSIASVDVDRLCPVYQYALFTTTRLMDKYKEYMFPHVTMSLGSFREDLQDYLDVIEEVYHDLYFEERLLTNGRVSFEADSYAKQSVSELAFWFWKFGSMINATMTTRDQDGDSSTHITDSAHDTPNNHGNGHHGNCHSDVAMLHKAYEEDKDRIQDEEAFRYCYEDTLKMIITDLERKEIWQLSTLYSNQAFSDYLKDKEPRTYQELNDDSLTIIVPKALQRKNVDTSSSDDE